MKKIFYLLLLVSLTACAQTSHEKIKSDIKNSRTAGHINIPGTRLYISPPPNFNIATTFTGLQKREGAMINIMDLTGGNFYTNAANFSKENFAAKGIKVFDYKDVTVSGFPAKYIFMQGDDAAKSYSLVFGDTTFSAMVMAVFPASDDATGQDIITALNTIWYDKNKKVNPFETANFSLNEHASKFKFFQYSANLYIYTIGGTENKEDKNAPGLLVSQFPGGNMNAEGVANMMISKMKQSTLAGAQIKNSGLLKLNGSEAYEAEVYGEINGQSSMIYYFVMVKDAKAIVIQGIARNDFENNVQEFKKIAHTLQVK